MQLDRRYGLNVEERQRTKLFIRVAARHVRVAEAPKDEEREAIKEDTALLLIMVFEIWKDHTRLSPLVRGAPLLIAEMGESTRG